MPDTPTPRSRHLVNDTPTPVVPTPGSWRERRRTGELVERPPKLRLNPPDSTISTSPEIQSSPETQSSQEKRSSAEGRRSSDEEPSSEEQAKRTTGSEWPRDPPFVTPELRVSTSSSSSGDNEGHRESQSGLDDLVQRPPLARVASRCDQLDGTSDERKLLRSPQHESSREKKRGSLRNLPAQLKEFFNRHKKSDESSEDPKETPKSKAKGEKHQSTWTKTTERFKKSLPRRAGKKSARGSLRHILSSSAADDQSGAVTSNTDIFNNRTAPKGTGAPTNEEDAISPVGLERGSVDEENVGEKIMWRHSSVGNAGPAKEEHERETVQSTSGGRAAPNPTVDRSRDQNDQSRPKPNRFLRIAHRSFEAFMTQEWNAMP